MSEIANLPSTRPAEVAEGEARSRGGFAEGEARSRGQVGAPAAAVALESALLRTAGFRHGFSTRKFDFRPSPEREAAIASLGLVLRFDPERLFQASQVHGARTLIARGDRETF